MAARELTVETGPDNQGLYERNYAYIIAEIGKDGWSWRHMEQQNYHGPFDSEEDAYQDAATKLNGSYED